MKPEQWGTPLVQEKYQEEKACDKRHPYLVTTTTTTIIIIIIIIIIIKGKPSIVRIRCLKKTRKDFTETWA